jgi:cell fate regulator YaaT (PSP1 superfamily)
LRLLSLLAEKEFHLAAGEIETMGLMMDGLIENAHTYETQDIVVTDTATGRETFRQQYVQQFAARLTQKGKDFVAVWKSSSDNLIETLGRVE